jgi:hypothetical protein
MSTYVEARPLVESLRAEHRWRRPRLRPALTVACELLSRRMAGGGVERLPDPGRHPECWFRFL